VLAIIQGGKYASALQDDAASCGAPPCRKFDDTSAGYQSSGKTFNTLANIGIGVTVGATVVAGYFWYKELRAKKRGEVKVSKTPAPDAASSWVILPSIGDGHAGAAAAVRF
jgi:hypothetical protein